MPLSSLAREVRAQDYERFICCLCSPSALQMPLLTLLGLSAELAKVAAIASDPAPAYLRLKWWQHQLEQAASGAEMAPHPLAEPLMALYAAYPAVWPCLLHMIDGRAMELESRKGFTDQAAFYDYLDATAGALHLALAMVASGGLQDTLPEGLVKRAARLYAIIGLIRSIPAHAQQGIVRWPHDRLRQFGLSPAAVEQGVEQEALRHFLMFWCKEIERDAQTLAVDPAWKMPTLRLIRRLHSITMRYAKRLEYSNGDITHVIGRRPSLPMGVWLVR